MRWQGRKESKNIEDRRGQTTRPAMRTGMSGVGMGLLMRGGGKGIIIVVILFIGLSFFGFNPTRFLFGDGALESTRVEQGVIPQSNDERSRFIATVLAETEDTWTTIFKSHNATYKEPVLVRYSGAVHSACGTASAAVGPFYCPGDQKLYLDDSFFDQLSQQLNAPGEFAQAYVIAHEIGHHVQHLTGILDATNRQRARMNNRDANAISVRVELQADCYAGIWAHSTGQKGLLETGDIESALNAAHQIGDDTLQKSAQGTVVPDSFTHGTSAQRAEWFQRGYESGKLEACDTFNDNL